MKDLLDRHRDRLTPDEERRIWQAMTDARAHRPRPWRRVAVPSAAALALVFAFAAPRLFAPGVSDAPNVAGRGELTADPGTPQDLAQVDVEAQRPEEPAASTAATEAGASRAADVSAPPKPSDASGREAKGEGAGAAPPTASADEGGDVAARVEEPIESRPELERLPVDSFVEAQTLDAGIVSGENRAQAPAAGAPGRDARVRQEAVRDQDGSLHVRGGRAGEIGVALPPPQTSPEGRAGGLRTPAEAEGAKKASPYPISVGGNAPVNGEPYDAMFFRNYGVNPFVDPRDDRFATFAVDVDNASYALARSYLLDGNLPPAEAVRVEEFVNALRYDYLAPHGSFVAESREIPSEHGTFAIYLDAAPSPFHEGTTLLRVGLKGREIDARDRKPAVLTFVVDVSGSMAREDRLELVKRTLHLLLDEMEPRDEVALVVYGSDARTILPHTSLENRREIERAIDCLQPEGATNAEAGLLEGYRLADAAFQRGCINRVILCSDGVANVGNTGADSILERIRREAGRGIELTAVGFGMGNYNDVLMERLANDGDGNYYYVDDLDEAERVFVENLTGTLQTIARQTKIQVEFDPETVRSYRLIGYENRDVRDEDFRNDAVDAGEVGAGHEVTALFEVKFEEKGRRGDLATVRIRYEDPATRRVTEEARTIRREDIRRAWRDAEPSFRLAASAAQFAEILRGSYWAREDALAPVREEAREAAADFGRPDDARELVDLIGRAERLMPEADRSPRRDDDRE